MRGIKKHRYSFLILPGVFILDAVILLFFFLRPFQFDIWLIILLLIFWFVLSLFTNYYRVYRNTTLNELMELSFRHLTIFLLGFLAFLFIAGLEFQYHLLYKILLLILLLLLRKIFVFLLLKKYRSYGLNVRYYAIFGCNDELVRFHDLLEQRKDFGYQFTGYFSDKNCSEQKLLGNYQQGLKYISEELNGVDVVFVSLKEHSDQQISEIIKTANNHFISIKFIPDNKNIYRQRLFLEYFEYYPVLSLRKSPLDDPVNAFIKRVFDIVFSLVIIVGILSWLTPILAILIKLESKGPVFFKQKRNGLNYKPFYCYKFRSMRPNPEADIKQVSKQDDRVTRIGRILRKTSIDELPQFINVLKGEMSVVGPRPHMINESERFRKVLDQFILRHYVKPGITGLAQIKGYRGEVQNKEDIINRVKYDLYYIENWSLFLDLKIIFQTVLKIFTGDKKAY